MRPGSKSKSLPSRHLAIGDGAQTMWIKLRWEANLIKDAHGKRPVDAISLMFGAINFAITARALEDWASKELQQRERRNGFNSAKYRKDIQAAVPMQPAFRDIANTAKHGAYREENWLGGTVELVHMPGLADTDREFALIYHAEDGHAHDSLTMFETAANDWLRYLRAQKLIVGL
ncbi:hypothetical protein TomTYG45_09670 [Sphingobium sp. TomTYG45]